MSDERLAIDPRSEELLNEIRATLKRVRDELATTRPKARALRADPDLQDFAYNLVARLGSLETDALILSSDIRRRRVRHDPIDEQ